MSPGTITTYEPLPGHCPDSPSGSLSQTSFGDDERSVHDDPGCRAGHTKLRRSSLCHWIAHAVSATIILLLAGSLAAVLRDGPYQAERCWNMHNYYCEIIHPLFPCILNTPEFQTT